MNEFFTWATLGTYAGAVLATGLVTQMFKGVSFFDRIPTRFTAYLIALVILLAADAIAGTITLASAALSVINSVVVALAASGGYDAIDQIRNPE